MAQLTQEIRLNNLRDLLDLNYMNQYVKLASLTVSSKMHLSTHNKLILERNCNPLTGKENEMEIE